jgi:UDP-GlcNAc:undecaprenyl-phosphate/decaprenyl-phosphate GlcNAc-1-phosphate transferase
LQQYWVLYITMFASSFLVSLLFTPYAKKISIYAGCIDLPKKRGMHKEPMPRMGGLAIVLGYSFSMLILIIFLEEVRNLEFLGFLIGGAIIVSLGILDDIYNVSPKIKILFQLSAATVVILTGTRIEFFSLPIMLNLSIFDIPLTLIWIIGITNAVNLIDGLDGLAAGVSSIIAITLSIVCIMAGSVLGAALTISLAGSCLGFLPRNFSPAEIFMGDTGALFLGYVLAVTSIIGVYKSYALLAIAICGFALALPIFDTLFAMFRRFKSGKPIMEADRGHLHHRLVDTGISPSRSVIILYFITGISGSIAILIALNSITTSIFSVVILTTISTIMYVYRKRVNGTELNAQHIDVSNDFLEKLHEEETKEDIQETKEDIQETKEDMQETKEDIQETKEDIQETKEEKALNMIEGNQPKNNIKKVDTKIKVIKENKLEDTSEEAI